MYENFVLGLFLIGWEKNLMFDWLEQKSLPTSKMSQNKGTPRVLTIYLYIEYKEIECQTLSYIVYITVLIQMDQGPD